MVFNRSGDLVVKLTIPWEHRGEGTKLADAYGANIRMTAIRSQDYEE